jgi:hypothetical protein
MKIALALSGGGVRAAAHLGIVEVLQQNGFEVAALSGRCSQTDTRRRRSAPSSRRSKPGI